MPDVLEPTTRTTVNPRYAGLRPFNSQRAREAALKRYAQERERAAEAARLRVESIVSHTQDQRLALLEEQIARTRITLNGELEPQHRAALLRALCDLLDQQRIARGEPLPGSRKPPPERRQVNDAPLRPVPAPSCGPDTTTNGVNQQQPVNETTQGNSSQ